MIVPFFFSPHDVREGPRFGGSPPAGFGDAARGDYLLTLPLPDRPGWEFSVFLNATFSFISRRRGKWLADDSIEVIVHPQSTRGEGAGTYHGYALDLRPPVVEDEEPYPTHKLGGRPFLIHDDNKGLSRAIANAEREQFVQVLQLDIPANREDAAADVDWPFGDGLFHLYGRPPYSGGWQWFWEMQ